MSQICEAICSESSVACYFHTSYLARRCETVYACDVEQISVSSALFCFQCLIIFFFII